MSDKPHKSLETRAMRKAVERVDIGAFGTPLKIVNWIKAKKASWGGWIIVTLIQALVGAGIGYGLMSFFGIPFNALSIAIYGCFIIGSAIGGPFVFTIWTLFFVGLTHLVAGNFSGAWIGSAEWWGKLVVMWNSGKSIPGWFQAAVPIWMFIWVIASRGIAKGADILLEKLALALGFRAASRFSSEEKQVYEDAFRKSDVSPTETQSLMESSNDGTHAVIAGETLMQRDRPETLSSDVHNDSLSFAKPTLADGGLDYDNLLDDGASDPEVLQAIGVRSEEEALSEPVAEDASAEDVQSSDGPVLVEMSPTKLPDVPRDNAPPIRRVTAPEVDFRANRALHRRMSQILFAFNKYRHEDREAEYIEENSGELSAISDEQRRILESLDESGPLLAVISAIQQKNAESFLASNGEVAILPGTGSLEGPAIQDDDEEEISTARVVDDIVIDEGDEDIAAATSPASGPKADIASMAASFSKALTSRRGPASKNEDKADLTDETADVKTVVSDVAAAEDIAQAPADPEESKPVASNEDASTSHDAANIPAIESSNETDTIVAETAEGEKFPFEVALENDENPEDKLNNKDFGRMLCRQVLGIVQAADDPSIKAEDVAEFERQNPAVSIGEIINSRAFDEHVGNVEASNARRQWREIREIMSQSSSDKLISDFEKINLRGENLCEVPSQLTEASFNLFERDSVRIRSLVIASKDDQLMAEASSLLSRNVLLVDMLKKILDDREKEAQRLTRPSSQPGGVVRQKIAKSDDAVVERGRSLASAVFKRAGADGSVLRPVENEASQSSADADDEESLTTQSLIEDNKDNVMPADTVPALGEEGYVSPYAEGTREYDRDMQMHNMHLEMNRKFAEEDRRLKEQQEQDLADQKAAEDRIREENDAEIRRLRIEAETRRIAEEEASRAQIMAAKQREAQQNAERAADEREAQRLIRDNARALQHRTIADNALLDAVRKMQKANDVPERFYECVMAQVITLHEMRSYSLLLKRQRAFGASNADLSESENLIANPSLRLSLVLEADMGEVASKIIVNIAQFLDVDPDDIEKLRNMMDGDMEKNFMGRMIALVERRDVVLQVLAQADEDAKAVLDSVEIAANATQIQEQLEEVEKTASEAKDLLEQEKAESSKIKADLAAALERASAAEKALDRMEKEKAGIIDDDFQAVLDKHAKIFEEEGVSMPGFFILFTKDKSITNVIITAPMDAFPSGIAIFDDVPMPIADLVDFIMGKMKTIKTKSERVLILDPKLRAYLDEKGFIIEDITRSVPSFEEILGVKFED